MVNSESLYQVIALDIAGTKSTPVGLSAEQNDCADASGASGVSGCTSTTISSLANEVHPTEHSPAIVSVITTLSMKLPTLLLLPAVLTASKIK